MTTAPKRRWFRFSLRRLVVSVTLFALSFGAWSTMSMLPANNPAYRPLGFVLFVVGTLLPCIAIGALFRRWILGSTVAAIVGVGLAAFVASGGVIAAMRLIR